MGENSSYTKIVMSHWWRRSRGYIRVNYTYTLLILNKSNCDHMFSLWQYREHIWGDAVLFHEYRILSRQLYDLISSNFIHLICGRYQFFISLRQDIVSLCMISGHIWIRSLVLIHYQIRTQTLSHTGNQARWPTARDAVSAIKIHPFN